MANRDLLKEAIADAKAVKETAIANAKAALEEAFNPMMRERLAAKIAEMDNDDDYSIEEEIEEVEEGKDSFTTTEKSPAGYGSVKHSVNDYSDDHSKTTLKKSDIDENEEMDELDLDELLRELDELEEDGFGKFSSDGTEGFSAEEAGETPMKALDEAEGEEDYEDKDADGVEDSEDEEIDIESMDESDLKSFIEGVIADMVAAGELEGGEGMEGEEHDEPDADNMGGPSDHDADNADEEEMMNEIKKLKKEKEEAKKELKEALDTISSIKTELQEVNLFNAKLLYTNKIFKAKTLTESQKVKVLAAFDKAASVKEAKLVFETLSAGFVEKKAPMNESLMRGGASKAAGIAVKKPILESNDQVARWQKLAGIK
jgi:hypothetical protein